MSGRYLLDTNVAIRVLEKEVDLETRRGTGIQAFLCLTVVGELHFGAECSGKPEANRARIDRLLAICPVIGDDLETARRYAALKATLRRLGRPIPENDLWIAASALRHGLVLATRDAHFEHVEGLAVESW